MEVSLEQSEYTVNEGIGKANRALQICAVTMDLLFGVQVSLDVQNGSATGNTVTLPSSKSQIICFVLWMADHCLYDSYGTLWCISYHLSS